GGRPREGCCRAPRSRRAGGAEDYRSDRCTGDHADASGVDVQSLGSGGGGDRVETGPERGTPPTDRPPVRSPSTPPRPTVRPWRWSHPLTTIPLWCWLI